MFFVVIGFSAGLEPMENLNSDGKNNKIEDNIDAFTNEYLFFLFNDRKLTNEYLILKSDAQEQDDDNADGNKTLEPIVPEIQSIEMVDTNSSDVNSTKERIKDEI